MSSISPEEKQRLRDDDANWKLGVLYFCPKDPAFLVPKRVGIGWGFNYGSPWALVFVFAVIATLIWAIVF